MSINRRQTMAAGLALAMPVIAHAGTETHGDNQPMYGLIGQFSAQPGKRDELAAILLESVGAMPGCLSYIVAEDPSDDDALWITEVWDNRENHQASLVLPAVQAAITRARPLIAGFGARHETKPLGGVGI